MLSADKIKEFKKRYVTDPDSLYSKVRNEQKTDQSYRDDTFPVDEVRTPHKVWRSGIGARMVDAPAEQIITSNPQAFFEVTKSDVAVRLSKEVNQNWISILRRQNPNPFKEFVKNLGARGEAFIKIVHNEKWVTGTKDRTGLPVLFLILDPMVIYASPEEDENGVPHRVLIFYERQPNDVIVRYPTWTKPSSAKNEKMVEWFEYWDKDTMHFEADEIVVKHQVNPYKKPPFVRKYSGFGRRSEDGELANLIVSDIRLSRDLIKQECITRSNIASIEHIFAHKPRTIMSPGELSEDQLQELSWGDYDLNVLTNVPTGTELVKEEISAVPQEMYMNLSKIQQEIAQRNPFIMAGFPLGSSGRQQDISQSAAMRRYDTVVENTENAWATAFELALKICDVIPTLKPSGIQKGDLDTSFGCSVKLKAPDPVEEDRLATLGDRLRRLPSPAIDLETFHTQYCGYTQEESKKIQAKILADMVTINNPDVAAVMGMVAAEETGMERWLEMAQQRRQMMEAQQKGLQETPSAQQRTQGEVQTPLGREQEPEGTRGARRPPERYIRS